LTLTLFINIIDLKTIFVVMNAQIIIEKLFLLYIKNVKYVKKWFPVKISKTNQRFCSNKCQGVWQSKELRGKKLIIINIENMLNY